MSENIYEKVFDDLSKFELVQIEDDEEKLNVRVLFTFDNDLNSYQYSYCVLSKLDNPNLEGLEEEDIIFCIKHLEDATKETVDFTKESDEIEMVKHAFIQWSNDETSN